MSNEQDLTVGRVSGTLIKSALPPLAANLLQPFYSIVDMLVVGDMIGETELAAISNASMISFIINSICIGITTGNAVLATQYKGAGDEEGQRETTGTLFSIVFIASIVVTMLGLLFYDPVFQVLGVSAASMEDTCDHMRIICGGTVFVFGYNMVCSILKGYGSSRTPLYFIAAAAVINIVLDILLMKPLGTGTRGTAHATIFSQGVSLLISILHLKREGILLDLRWKHPRIHRDKLVMVLKVGLPSAVQMVIVNISYLPVTGMLSRFGVSVVAAPGIGLEVNTLVGMPRRAIGQTVTAMAGQNMGADDLRRAKGTIKTGLCLNIPVTLTAVLFMQISAGSIIALFESGSPGVLADGIPYLKVYCGIDSLVYAVMYTLDSFTIEIGSASIVMIGALLDTVIVRLPLGFLLAFMADIGFTGIYIRQAVSPVLPAIVDLLYFKSGIWERKSLIH